jgi:hypothetical protein
MKSQSTAGLAFLFELESYIYTLSSLEQPAWSSAVCGGSKESARVTDRADVAKRLISVMWVSTKSMIPLSRSKFVITHWRMQKWK